MRRSFKFSGFVNAVAQRSNVSWKGLQPFSDREEIAGIDSVDILIAVKRSPFYGCYIQ